MARVLAPEDVLNVRFAQTQFRDGYDEREVDDFLDAVVVALRYYAEGRPASAAPLTAVKVERMRFTPTRLRRGYDHADVDAFLGDVAHTLRQHESGAGAVVGSGSPTVPSPSPGRPSPAAPTATGETEPFGRRILRLLRGERG